jgi:hypothetical protein
MSAKRALSHSGMLLDAGYGAFEEVAGKTTLIGRTVGNTSSSGRMVVVRSGRVFSVIFRLRNRKIL